MPLTMCAWREVGLGKRELSIRSPVHLDRVVHLRCPFKQDRGRKVSVRGFTYRTTLIQTLHWVLKLWQVAHASDIRGSTLKDTLHAEFRHGLMEPSTSHKEWGVIETQPLTPMRRRSKDPQCKNRIGRVLSHHAWWNTKKTLNVVVT